MYPLKVQSILALVALFVPHLGAEIVQPTKANLWLERRYTGGDSKTPIASVAAALLSKDSTVYVLDQDNSVIHVARGGTQVRIISRRGSGPGEIQRPNRMSFVGDSIAVPDASLARVTLFALKGRGVRTVPVASASASGYYGVDPAAFGPSATLMWGYNVSGLSTSPTTSNDVALFVRRHGSTSLQELARLSRGDIRMPIPVVLRGQPATMPRVQPFVLTPTWDWGRDGAGAVVLDTESRTANTVSMRLRQWSNDGRLTRTCTTSRPLIPISNAAYEAGLKSVGPPPGSERLVQVDWSAVRKLVVRPSTLPPFRSVRLASDGTVWIRTEAGFLGKNEEYLVLSRTGCGAPRVVQLPLDAIVEDARGSLFITSGFVEEAPTIDTWRY